MVDKRLVFHFLLIFVLLIFASVLYSLSDVYGRLKFQSNYTVQIQINRHHNNVGQTETWQANSTYCGNVTMPSRGLRERQKWVEVIQDTVFAFSAHYDDVSELPAVRIVGAKVFQEIEKMACRLWFPSEEFYHRVLVVEAEVRHLPKYLRRKYKYASRMGWVYKCVCCMLCMFVCVLYVVYVCVVYIYIIRLQTTSNHFFNPKRLYPGFIAPACLLTCLVIVCYS